MYVQFLRYSNPLLDSSCPSNGKRKNGSRSPIYNGSHEVAPRFPTVQRLLQSSKAALHKGM
jgi:hypothetical protein